MKILIDGRLLSKKASGIDRYTRECINAAIRHFGYEQVHVLVMNTFDDIPVQQIIHHRKPFHLGHVILNSFESFWNDYEIVLVPFYVHRLFKHSNISIVVVHDLMFEKVNLFFHSNAIINFLAKIYYRFLVKNSLKQAHHIIAVSKTTHDDIKNYGFESNIYPEGVNSLISDESNIRAAFHQDTEFYLYVGNNRRHKNLNSLIHAVHQGLINKELWIVSNSFVDIYPHPLIKHFRDVNDAELKHLYRHCLALIIPSLYEGFGLTVLEALQAHTKIICSNAGALKEFPSEFVLFYDATNERSLTIALQNLQHFNIDADRLNTYLNKFNWEKIMDKMFLDIITKI